MRTILIQKTFKLFDELNPEQKTKALDKYRLWNVEHDDWSRDILEGYTARLKRLGFYAVGWEWSGFSSQGDGAGFTAKHERRGEVFKIGRDVRQYSMYCDDKAVQAVARRIACECYRDLESAYDELTSDESVGDSLVANEVEFLDSEAEGHNKTCNDLALALNDVRAKVGVTSLFSLDELDKMNDLLLRYKLETKGGA